MKNYILLSLILLFSACSKVNVVLLPEEGDKVGKIEIKNENKIYKIEKPYHQINAIDGNSEILTKKEIYKKFGDTIESLPKKPKRHILYFKWDSTQIVPKAQKILKKIIHESKKTDVHYIDIIGYTDRAGEKEYNKKLSLRRANSIKKSLLKNNIKNEKISIDYYGESNPIIKTQDGVAKKVNRRVEVIIK